MAKRPASVQASTFNPGDYVRLKKGGQRDVGVVCRVDRGKIQVYWRDDGTLSQDHQAQELERVSENQAPRYAVELKRSLRPC
jgi:hypothetical protein